MCSLLTAPSLLWPPSYLLHVLCVSIRCSEWQLLVWCQWLRRYPFFFFFKADLISAHFLCGVNGSCTSWLWKENKTGAIADMQTSGRLCTQCHLRAGRPIRTGNNHYAPLPLWLQFVLNCLTCHLAFLVFPVPPKPLLSTRCTGVIVLLVKTGVVMRWVWSQFWRR